MPQLHGPLLSYDQRFADFLVAFPIFLVTIFAAVENVSAYLATGKSKVRRFYEIAGEALHKHVDLYLWLWCLGGAEDTISVQD
jgi:hypothetical protein